MNPRRRIVVAGTAGGVGTTTVAALTFFGLADQTFSAPVLYDHTAGELGRRLPDGDEVLHLDHRLELIDLGAHAAAALAELDQRSTTLCLVSAATPIGAQLAAERLAEIEAGGHDGLARTVLVLTGAQGRGRVVRETRRLAATAGLRSLVRLPRDLALTTGGRIPLPRLTRSTRRAISELATALQAGRRADSAGVDGSDPGSDDPGQPPARARREAPTPEH